jgi:hypothetical protein
MLGQFYPSKLICECQHLLMDHTNYAAQFAFDLIMKHTMHILTIVVHGNRGWVLSPHALKTYWHVCFRTKNGLAVDSFHGSLFLSTPICIEASLLDFLKRLLGNKVRIP